MNTNTGMESLPGFSFGEMVDSFSLNGYTFDISGFFKRICDLFFGEVVNSYGVMLKLAAIIIGTGILHAMQPDSGTGLAKAARFCSFALISGIAIECFGRTLSMADTFTTQCITFQQTASIWMGGIMMTTGRVAAAGAFSATLLAIGQITVIVIKNVIMPLTYLSLALTLTNGFNERLPLDKLSALTRKTALFILTAMMTLFMAVLAVTGAASGAVDAVASKTVKMTISALVPVAGGIIADGADAAAGSLQLIKNATGAGAFIFMIAAAAMPLIKIIVIVLIFKLLAALSEPFAEKALCKALDAMADTLSISFTVILAVLVIAVISIGMML